MKAHLIKLANGVFSPATAQDHAAFERVKMGRVIAVEWSQPRNYQFLRKFFALLNVAYESWEPEDKLYKGEPVAKNFDQFRNDVVVLAGYYETTVTMRGDVRLIAKSISFASMGQDEFTALYDAVANVILSRVLRTYTREDLDTVVEKILGFV